MKIIKSTETPTGILSDKQKAFMRQHNSNPKFPEKKPWVLKKVLKSNTDNVAWHFLVGEENFVAIQVFVPRLGNAVRIIEATPRGDFRQQKECATYTSYVDLESAVDLFFKNNFPQDEKELAQPTQDAVDSPAEAV